MKHVCHSTAQAKQKMRATVERLKKMTKLNKTSDIYIRNAQLRIDAINGISKNLAKDDAVGENLQITLDYQMSIAANTMMIPTLLLRMRKCKEMYEHHRAKAI